MNKFQYRLTNWYGEEGILNSVVEQFKKYGEESYYEIVKSKDRYFKDRYAIFTTGKNVTTEKDMVRAI